MINAIINGNFIDWITSTICMMPGIIIALCVHEFAHAYVADKAGDPTPRAMGRVSLNPGAHIDAIGMIALVLIHFGWGKPVIINRNNFKKQRRDSIFVAFAGVAMNFVVATALGLALQFSLKSDAILLFFARNTAGEIIWEILTDIVVINYSLMFFNLLPVPPLDGFNIFTEIFNLRGTKVWNFVYHYSFPILLLIILFDIPELILSKPLSFLVNFIVLGVH